MPKGILIDPKFFELYQSKGWHVTPVHFYQPIPNTSELTDKIWQEPSSMLGVDTNMDAQINILKEITETYLYEYQNILIEPPKSVTQYSRSDGSGFAGVDGAVLYSFIRKYKPKRIIEIGSGYSTLISILALKRNKDESYSSVGKIMSIEPYPKDFLQQALGDVGELVQEKVENVSLAEFEKLEENDILFIDSSHTVKIGGDVIYEILEIIPRLKKGVLIHIHDIFLPLPYPKDWVKNRHIFWTEQYLLQAFMAFNREFEVVWSAGLMHVNQPKLLTQYFPYYDSKNESPGSFWIKRCK